MKIRILFSLILLLIGLLLPFWIFCIGAFLYAWIWSPYDILVYAVLIDAEFSHTKSIIPYQYTVVVSVLLILSFYLKPFLRFYK